MLRYQTQGATARLVNAGNLPGEIKEPMLLYYIWQNQPFFMFDQETGGKPVH